jgi:hypothetical protein
MTIDRKQFLKQSAALGGCCGLALAGAAGLADAATPAAVPAAGVTPLDARVKQGQQVIMRLIGQLDQQLDVGKRASIMEACGRLCQQGTHPPAPTPTAEQAQQFMAGIAKYVGAENVQESAAGTAINFVFKQNPEGLKTADGYCLCPIFEDAPKGISPTYCQCSVGYMKGMFERGTGRPAQVELKDSVLRGSRQCSFVVTLAPASA